MTNLELADKLQKEAGHFSGAQDLVGMLWDAGAALRNLHTENTALRVTEDNLRQELQECQDQRRAAFRRIEEIDAMLAQIGHGEPAAWKHDCAVLLANDVELWIDACPHCGKPRHHPAPQQKPLTDEQIGMAFRKTFPVGSVVFTNGAIEFARAIEAAHGIGEKK